MPIDKRPPTSAERVGLALILGVLGFVTGVLTVWTVSGLPGVQIGQGVYLAVGGIAGLSCLVMGYRSSNATLDALGEVWGVVWKLSVGLFGIIKSLAR